MPDPTIRGYRPSDLAGCRTLWVELTQWHREIYDAPGIGGAEPGLQFDEHLARVGPANLWVAVDDGRVVGLAGLIPGDWEVEPAVVGEPYRGRGIGSTLVATAIAAARASGATTVSVRPVARNVAAIRFFAELGFDVVGHVELMMDLRPGSASRWTDGEVLAGRPFRI